MFITYLGHSCFKLQDKDVTVITDPYGPDFGLKPPRLKAEIVTISHDHSDHNYANSIMGDPLVIKGPGEFEVKGVYINGLASWHDGQQGKERGANTIYRFEMDNVVIVHLGDLGHVLAESMVEQLAGTDVLLVPVGGVASLNAKQAVEVINQLEPRIVIPMHYDLPEFKMKVKFDGVDKFCREIGICKTEAVDKLKVVKKELPQEKTEVVVMSLVK
ncbi:MAG: MBL fold metallo-hydrolase [bacterium]